MVEKVGTLDRILHVGYLGDRGHYGKGIHTSPISVGWYPAHIWQSPMNAMWWLESRISNGEVIIHPAEPAVFVL